jgi:hypothetical protein
MADVRRHQIDDYVELEVFQSELAPRATQVFTDAIAQAAGHSDHRVRTLLEYLKSLRNENLREDQGGPFIELTIDSNRFLMRGQAFENMIQFETGPHVLDDKDAVTETARCFTHELAHLFLLRKYANVSHPWRYPFKGSPEQTTAATGIPFGEWPKEVQAAYQEFEQGGKNGVARDDPEWARLIGGLKATEYYNPDKGVDFRGRELVSHLIELVYAWKSEERFDGSFPKCRVLLADVLTRPEPT